tara:strand:+ start:12990 stop:15320 length:2331 start_codon:yes stop_codon:yes gene_type:complete
MDVSQSVEITYTADISELTKQLEKLPGQTKESAAKMAKQFSHEMKETEKATKRAASTNSKSMKRMSNDTKQATRHFRQMKREASEIGRGLVDLAVIFGDAESPLGELVNQMGLLGIAAGSVFPIFQHLRTAVVGLGVSSAVATGGLTALAGVAATLVFSLSDGNDELKDQQEELERAEKAFDKYNNELDKTRKKVKKLAEGVLVARNALSTMREEIELESLRLRAEIDPSLMPELQKLEERFAFKGIEQRVKKTFGKVSESLDKQLDEQKKAVTSARNAANAMLQNLPSENLRDAIGVLDPKDLDMMDKAKRVLDEQFDITVKMAGTDTGIVLKEEDLAKTKRFHQALKDFADESAKLESIELERTNLSRSRSEEEEKMIEALKENFRLEQQIEATSKKTSGSKKGRSATEQKIVELLKTQQELEKIGAEINKANQTPLEKQLQAIKDQENKVVDLIEKNFALHKSHENVLDVSKELNALAEQRVKILDQQNIISTQLQRQDRLGLLEKEISLTTNKLHLEDQIAERHQLQFEQLRLAHLNRKEELQTAIRIADEEAHLGVLAELKNNLAQEELLFEEKAAMLRLENAKKLQQEEKRLRDLQMGGYSALIENLKTFTATAMKSSENQANADLRAQDRLFRMQQALTLAKIAMDAASGTVNAMSQYGPILGPIIAGTIAAQAGVQASVVASQSPPSASAHTGQAMAPDERVIRVLTGEAVLDRATVQRMGGEQGVRSLQNNNASAKNVVILNTYKHFDKYNRSAKKMSSNKRGSGRY